MNWLPSLGAWQFAVAGVVTAAGTVLVHLLNRRRHQTLYWGAMEFLQQAAKRKRRSIQLRDAILLALRTLAALLFGLALSRPHFSADDRIVGPQPVHAIIVIDNSLSMSYVTLEGSLLSKAKQADVQIVERLPDGSNVSVLASSGSSEFDSEMPTSDLQSVLDAIDRIEIADTSASINAILAKAVSAAEFETNLPRRTVLLTDQQAMTWEGYDSSDSTSSPRSLQIVDLAPPDRDNAWVAGIEVQDGFAEARTQATIRVLIQRSGGKAVRNSEVSLLVNDQLVATKSVALEAGDSSQVVTFDHSFITSGANDTTFVPVKATLTPDRLKVDDTRYALVPVVTRLPVVFVDQFGASEEDVRRGRIGETHALRRLLNSDRDDDLRKIVVGQTHIAIDELDVNSIERAKLIVIAGVPSPQGKVTLLREYLTDGGQLLIAAGGEFSASSWQDFAWENGGGILPARLTGNLIGTTPDETKGALEPKLLAFESLENSELLRLPGVSDESLRDLYGEALFFKTAEIDEMQGSKQKHRVLARLESIEGSPLLLERGIGKGRVLFWTSSITSNWNTVAKSNVVVMLDRVSREAIRSMIENRNRTTQARLPIELPVGVRDSKVMLNRPGQATAIELKSEYINKEQFGVTIRDPFRRGFYEVAAVSKDASIGHETDSPLWEVELAINGDGRESDLTAADDKSIGALAQHRSVTLTRDAESVSLADVNLFTRSSWWWFALVVLILLVVETLVLVAGSNRRAVALSARASA